jgi:hypothetical protein
MDYGRVSLSCWPGPCVTGPWGPGDRDIFRYGAGDTCHLGTAPSDTQENIRDTQYALHPSGRQLNLLCSYPRLNCPDMPVAWFQIYFRPPTGALPSPFHSSSFSLCLPLLSWRQFFRLHLLSGGETLLAHAACLVSLFPKGAMLPVLIGDRADVTADGRRNGPGASSRVQRVNSEPPTLS